MRRGLLAQDQQSPRLDQHAQRSADGPRCRIIGSCFPALLFAFLFLPRASPPSGVTEARLLWFHSAFMYRIRNIGIGLRRRTGAGNAATSMPRRAARDSHEQCYIERHGQVATSARTSNGSEGRSTAEGLRRDVPARWYDLPRFFIKALYSLNHRLGPSRSRDDPKSTLVNRSAQIAKRRDVVPRLRDFDRVHQSS